MLPLWPEYSASTDAADVLGAVRFGDVVALESTPVPTLTLALPPLDGVPHEVWRSPLPVKARGTDGAVAFAANELVLFGALATAETDVERAAASAYNSIVETTRRLGYPNLVRVWNHVRSINEGSGEDERYKRFCAGRHDALTSASLRKSEFSAASAVGMGSGELAIYFLASNSGTMQIENPRQISAYEYPQEYGRKSPSFSRATLAKWGSEEMLFISGTASVVGHATEHVRDVRAQAEETLVNLEAVLSASPGGFTLSDIRTVKVYVREAGDPQWLRQRFRSALPNASLLVVKSDICRRDLLLEAEAIAWR